MPQGSFDTHFTDVSAWECIARQLEMGHEVETVALRKPPNAEGYVMHMQIPPNEHPVYVKVQLSKDKIVGRSFHISYRDGGA